MSKETEYSLTLTGFKNKKQVQEFYDWFEGQGEQDLSVWLEYNDKSGATAMHADMQVKPKWNGANMTAKMQIFESE